MLYISLGWVALERRCLPCVKRLPLDMGVLAVRQLGTGASLALGAPDACRKTDATLS
jgi:hypothetical protein